ncbi:MAG: Hsp20/alpha crystallin family protein [Candidatus Adiutrix sp.]
MSIFKFNPRGQNFPSPMLELEKMRNHMETIYSALAGGIGQIKKNYTGVFPPVNLTEDDDNLYLMAELPGADPSKLEVSIKGDTLALRGEITRAEAADNLNYHRKERQSGNFRRNVSLPVKVAIDEINASFKQGILTVTMPKAAEAKPHQVNIKTD